METPEEQIRAVQIAVTMLIAQASTGVRDLSMVHSDLCSEIFKLLAMPRVLSDARHQLSKTAGSRSLDVKKRREERIRAVPYIIIQVESFCMARNLPSILPVGGEVRNAFWGEQKEFSGRFRVWVAAPFLFSHSLLLVFSLRLRESSSLAHCE